MKPSSRPPVAPSRFPNFCSFLFTVCLFLSSAASAAPSITLSKKSGPPTSRILVSGGGFEPNVGVDIFFGKQDQALVVTNGKGEFHDQPIYAPRSAHPGEHWVTALERNNDKGAQKPFLVRTDWNQFHFSPDLDGLNPYENVLSPHTAGRLGLEWSFPTHYYVYSSPAVVGGVVYIGSVKDSLYALKASTGAKLWEFQTSGRVLDGAAVAKGIIYVGSEGGDFHALRADSGKELWRFSANGDVGSPTVVNDVAYVDSLTMYALKAGTGEQLWSFSDGSAWFSAPAVVDGSVYFSSTNGNVYALDAKTGMLLWSYSTDQYNQTAPAVVDGVVYAPSWGGNLYALDSATGSLLWTYTTNGAVTCSPAVANGVVYLGSNGGNVYALDAATGAELWRVPAGPCYGSSPAIANGVIYIGGNQNIYALDAATGAGLWTYATANTVQSSPAVANGVVYVGSNDENVYAFGLADAKRDSEKEKVAVAPSDTGRLRPDFSLKVVEPGITTSRN